MLEEVKLMLMFVVYLLTLLLLPLLDIVSVWDGVSQVISKQMRLQKVIHDKLNVLKLVFRVEFRINRLLIM